MNQLERQIRTTQHRLWLRRGLGFLGWWLAGGFALVAVVILVQRLFLLPFELPWIGAAVVLASAACAAICTFATRETAETAAAELDRAAGLKERLSTAHYCREEDDPFAAAVRSDAERVAGLVTPRVYIRIPVPFSAAYATASLVVLLLCFAVPRGLLARDAEEREERSAEIEETRVAVSRELDRVRQLMETTPTLADLKDELEPPDPLAGAELKPTMIRHEAVKSIDRLADAIKQRRETAQHEALQEMRRMMRGLQGPKSPDAPTKKLSRSLAQGDFKNAREEIKALREQLATLKTDQDRELVERISKQLDELAEQLEKLTKDNRLAERLKQAGLKPEDVQRMLEQLQKKDLDQIKKELEEKGVPPEQAQRLAEKVQRRQQANQMTQKLAQAMRQGAMGSDPGQMDDAMAGLSMAADQLGDLEALELEMNQLDSILAELQNSRAGLDQPPCSACQGSGCPACGGSGTGMGELGVGQGGLAPEQQTDVGFKTERGKVHTGRGAIVGQFLVDGEQVKGDVSQAMAEVLTAAERDASDRINRNRIPRQYQQAVRQYFSHVQQSVGVPVRESSTTETPSGDASESDPP